MDLKQWADAWLIPDEAINELKRMLGLAEAATLSGGSDNASESYVQKSIRFEAAQKGIILWRNNVGMAADPHGNVVRFGLANDTKEMNHRIKSSDLIGIKPNGQFICREVKKLGWVYRGTQPEKAQRAFIELVLSKGGDAGFATGVGTL